MTRVLIVDDKPENLYLLHALLQGHGCEVEEARHGAEALVKARQNPPGLIISDLLMPVMDGYTLLRQWKSDGRLKQIPFIVYTATYTDPKDEKLALDLGADAFLLKPAEPEPFMALIRDVLAKAQSGTFVDPRQSIGEEKVLLKEYNEALVRKLEAKALELEDKVRERTAALTESERSLDSILNSLLTFTVLLTPDGRILHVNEAPLRASGMSRSEVLGRSFFEIPVWSYSEESTARIRDVVARAAAGETVTGEFRVRIAPERFIHMAAAFQPIRDPDGRVVRVLGEGLDVTERIRAKDELEASERKFRSLVSTIPGVVYRCETKPPWRMIFVSESALELTGYPPSEFMERGRTWVSIMVPEDLPRVMAVAEESERTGKPGLVEYRIRRADRTIRWVLESGHVAKHPEGVEPYAEGVVLDITPQKLAEAALEKSEEQRLRLEEQTRLRTRFEGMVGKSAPMQEVYRRLRLGAQSEVNVLLTGESGTGKELAAAALHELSARKSGPFVGVNCSAIPETLLESELFGHVKGAFTGAVRDKVGLIQTAHGGTLFLDEVGDMGPQVQVKMLRVLETREFRRVGDEVPIKVDVRLVTATNRDLQNLVASGKIREDFYYRIRVFDIRMPPLRERREDIPLLVEHFIREFAKSRARPVEGLAGDALRALMAHSWPGNVRELRNAIEHAFVTVEGGVLTLNDLPPEVQARPETEGKGEDERTRIMRALAECGGNKARAAKKLGVSRVTLWKRIRDLGIDKGDVNR